MQADIDKLISFESPVFSNRRRNETLDCASWATNNLPHAILYHSQTQKLYIFANAKHNFYRQFNFTFTCCGTHLLMH